MVRLAVQLAADEAPSPRRTTVRPPGGPPGIVETPLARGATKHIESAMKKEDDEAAKMWQKKGFVADANSKAAKDISREVIKQKANEKPRVRRASIGSVDTVAASVATASRRSSLSDEFALEDAEQRKIKPARKCCNCLSTVANFFGEGPVGGKDGDSDTSLSDDDEKDSQDPNRPTLMAQKMALARNALRFTVPELRAIRGRVREKFGVPDDDSPWPFYLRVQEATGILELRTLCEIKRIRVEEEPPDYPTARYIVSSLKFEAIVGVLIFINAAMIGWDTMFPKGAQKPWILNVSEYIFTFIFVVEFVLRVMASSWVWVFDPMNMFDAFVVWIVGVLTTYILIPVGVDVDVVQRMAALRILRLARLCRAIRMIPIFHELWMLVKGVMECMSLLFWAGVIIGTVHYMFAVATMELVVKTESFRNDPHVEEFFGGGLFASMFTLFQIMTFDSWAAIVRPIIYKEPATAVLFFFFIGIAGIVLFNLMTAIVVKNSFDAITEDEEAMAQLKHMEHMKMQQELREMFKDMDNDGSGTLSQAEFTDVLDDVMFIRRMKMMDIDLEELPDIFEILDDGDGQVSMDEFCMGLMRMQGVAMSRDTLKATQRLKRINEGFMGMSQDMEKYSEDTFESMEQALDVSHENFLEIQALTAEVLKQLNDIGIRKVVHESTTELPKLGEPTSESIAKEAKLAAKAKSTDPISSAQIFSTKQAQIPGAQMAPIPPAWIARRREEERKERREKNKKMVRARPRRVKEEVQEDCIGGVAMEFKEEWGRLDVQVEAPALNSTGPLRMTAGGPKPKDTQAMTLPGGLVQPVTTPGPAPGPIGAPLPPAAPPAAVPPPLPKDQEQANLPNSVPLEEGMSIV